MKYKIGGAVVVGIALAVACGKKAKEKTESTGGTLQTKFLQNSVKTEAQALAMKKFEMGRQDGMNLDVDPARIIGQSTAESFTAAKYRVIDIGLCGQASTKDDSCLARPWTLYQESATQDSNAYNDFVPSAATSFTDWIDFLDKTSTAKLASSATYSDVHVGAYEAVIVHFYRTFKIKASIPMNDGSTLYTKETTEFANNNKSGLDVTYAAISNKLTTAPAEEALFFLSNGGKTFFLQSPFQITADDVANKTNFKMVLAYDPHNAIKGQGYSKGGGAVTGEWLDGEIDTTNGYKITAPFMEFCPVLARSTETIMKESYLFYSEGKASTDTNSLEPSTPYSVRLTLYYVKEDSSKAVRCITSALVYNGDTASYLNFNPMGGLKSITTNADGSIDVYNSTKTFPVLKGFKRLTTVDSTGTVTGKICTTAAPDGVCSDATADLDFEYTLMGVSAEEETIAVPYETPMPSTSSITSTSTSTSTTLQ